MKKINLGELTFWGVLLLVASYLISLFVYPFLDGTSSASKYVQTIKQILIGDNPQEFTYAFIIGTLSILGMLAWALVVKKKQSH